MPKPEMPDDEFIEMFRTIGPVQLAKKVHTNRSNVYKRRRRLELRDHIVIKSPNKKGHGGEFYDKIGEYPHRRIETVTDGVILVGSDSHYWPNVESVAHRAFVKFAYEMKPAVIIKNGDELDFPGISRHAPIGWETRPKVVDEIECAKEKLYEIEKASPNSRFYWPLGNHDARFETRLATVASEYAKVHGVHLKDHFPRWKPCWSVWVNDNTVIKHRYKGGVHATHNNTVYSGKNIVTGHLHSLKVTPFSDYNGTRFGVDTGTMAAPYGPQFVDYTEDNPLNWRAGFAVLTFKDGELLWPEIVHVRNHESGECEFRGKTFIV